MTPTRLTLLAALLAPAGIAAAQAPPAAGMTLDQFLSRQTGRIMAADTDGDGKVSKAEMSATVRGGRDPARMFDAMDLDHDGYLDAGEIKDALTRRFRRMDRDGDGVVTPDERMAGRVRPGAAETGAANRNMAEPDMAQPDAPAPQP